MTLISLPRMFLSETEGWREIAGRHASAATMALTFVAPLSLLPPLLFAFAQVAYPGKVTPLVEPPFTAGELTLVGAAFFVAEMAMVALMGLYIQRITDSMGSFTAYDDAYRLAAISPTPLWLSSLALLVPSPWFALLVAVTAWVGTVALVRHGTRSLLGLADRDAAHRIADDIVVAGTSAWIALMVVLALILGIFLGWR